MNDLSPILSMEGTPIQIQVEGGFLNLDLNKHFL